MITVEIVFIIAILIAVLVSFPILGASFGRKGKTVRRGNGISLDRDYVRGRWLAIENTASLGGPSHLKSAIMDADKLVDHVLKSKGLAGETFAERLKGAKKLFPKYADYDNLWSAHKLRNSLAHDEGHDFNAGSAKQSLEYFRKALTILGALK